MNRYTLCFQDQFLENQFQQYRNSNYRLYLIQTFAVGFLILLVQTLMVLVDRHYYWGGFCGLLTLICLYMLVQLRRQKLRLEHAYFFHNMVVNLYPEITLYQCIYLDVSIQSAFTQILISQVITQSGIIQSNFIYGSCQLMNSLLAHTFGIYWRFGFCYQQSIMFLYYLFWAMQEYQRISITRSNFIATQVNDSIYEIVKNIMTSQVVIFDYDPEHLMFRTQQKFNVQKKDFTIQSSLKRIYIDNKTNLGEHIYNNFIKKTVHGFQKYTFHALIKNTKQKIKFELYVQTYPRTSFIIKLLEQIPMICPEELKYESKLVSQYMTQTQSIQSKKNPLKFLLRSQQALRIRLNLNHLMISYKFSKRIINKSLIKIQQLVKHIVCELELQIEFSESENQDLQLMLDKLLIQTLLNSILYLMNTKKNIVRFQIKQSQTVYQLVFYSQNRLNCSCLRFLNTRFYQNMNYLAHQLSFSDLVISEREIILDIMKISMSDVFL